MNYFVAGVVTFWLLVTLAEPALAQCTTTTVFTPDGRTVICTQCCYGGNCTVTCY